MRLFTQLSSQTKTFFLASIGVSGSLWKIFFDYGAYGEVFFEYIFTIVFISTALFFVYFLIEKEQRPFGIFGAFLFLFPSIWFLSSYTEIVSQFSVFSVLTDIVEGIVLIFSLPYIFYFIIFITQEDILVHQSVKTLFFLVFIGVCIAFSSYFIGAYNKHFLYCRDFKIAGMETPLECFSQKEERIINGSYE